MADRTPMNTTLPLYGLRNDLTYRQYIRATADERITTAAQEALWEYASQVANDVVNHDPLYSDLTDDEDRWATEYDRIHDQVTRDLCDELIRQLQAYRKDR